MTKPGRLACINPKCRITAPQDRHPNSDDMICRKCWRATPIALRKRILQLEKRQKKVAKLVQKHGVQPPESVTIHRIWRQSGRKWDEVRRYWQLPAENAPPEGIDDFLKEIGLA